MSKRMTTHARIPASRIFREIAVLNRLDTDATDYDVIKARVNELITELQIECRDVPSTEQLFRVRLNPDAKPQTIAEISAPPAGLVTGFQRCNPPNCPMFYTASTRNTALKECNAKPGDRFYLSQWMPETTFPAIMALADGLSDIGSASQSLENTTYIYLDTLFTRRIHSTFSNDYKLTAAFSELLRIKTTRPNDNGTMWEHYISLRYPSVAAIGTGTYNTVMHPDNAEELLMLNHVMEGEIKGVRGGQYEIAITDNAVDFSGGVINWTGDARRIPLLKHYADDGKAGVQFVVGRNAKGEKTLFLCTMSSNPSSSYVARLLDEPGCYNAAQQIASADHLRAARSSGG